MSSGIGEYFVRMRSATDEQTNDVLDTPTIERIEELHGAVVWAEKDRRFGMLRPRRDEEIRAARSAEEVFLNEHGFATYTDYRLRVRRSRVAAPAQVDRKEPIAAPEPVAPPEPVAVAEMDAEAEAAEEVTAEASLPETVPDVTPAVVDVGPEPVAAPPPLLAEPAPDAGTVEWAAALRDVFDRRLAEQVESAANPR
jgi:hypothetical protein